MFNLDTDFTGRSIIIDNTKGIANRTWNFFMAHIINSPEWALLRVRETNELWHVLLKR
jgi:hypothetical protein